MCIATFTGLSRARPSLKLSTYLQKHSKKAKKQELATTETNISSFSDNSPQVFEPLHFFLFVSPHKLELKRILGTKKQEQAY
jgi:hypothetical protein